MRDEGNVTREGKRRGRQRGIMKEIEGGKETSKALVTVSSSSDSYSLREGEDCRNGFDS